MDQLATLRGMVQSSGRMVFFGGAGVSTESGIPDFRSEGGLYRQKYPFPPETMLSHGFYQTHPAEFYDFYREKMLFLQARPNAAHQKLAQWEREGKLLGVITQNIDGLHQAAGAQTVWELHGSVHRNFCQQCGACFDAQFMRAFSGVPHCPCGGVIKPDVVLYGEGLDQTVLEEAIGALQRADLLLVGGTSLAVYPAAGLLEYYRGGPVVLINRDPTPYDHRADLVLRGKIGEILSAC